MTRENLLSNRSIEGEKSQGKDQSLHTDRDSLILQGLSQVEIIINQLKRKLPANIDWDNLRSAGVDGLMQAAERYDASTGNKFSTFAEQRIRGSIIDYIRKDSFGSRAANKFAKQREEAIHKATQHNGRKPTEEEIAVQMGMSLPDYRKKIVKYNPNADIVSIENLGNGDAQKDKYYSESILPVQPAIAGEGGGTAASNEFKLKENLKEALAKAGLNSDEKEILNLYFYQDLTLDDIAKHVGMHMSRVSQVKNSALQKISTFLHKVGYSIPEKFSVYKNKSGNPELGSELQEKIIQKTCSVFGLTRQELSLEPSLSPAKMVAVLAMRRQSIPFTNICAVLGLSEKDAKMNTIKALTQVVKDQELKNKLDDVEKF